MTENVTPEEILRFWLDEVGEDGWYNSSEALDTTIRERFGPAWEAARTVDAVPWHGTPDLTLASLILLDQFPRNMFRGSAQAFATDHLGLAAAREGIAAGFDLATPGDERRFYYMPFCHSEDLAVQDEGIAHVEAVTPEYGVLLHLRAHREVIARYGRFPYRNAALGRETTATEQAFLDAGGYGAIVRELKAEGAA